MMRRSAELALLVAVVFMPVQAASQEDPGIHEDLQRTYGAFATEVFACTQVLGFSQSLEWYGGLSLADYAVEDGPPQPPPLEAGAFLPTWQGRFFMGASVEQWTDPDYPGWSGTHSRAHESPTHCARDEVDRVVFNVSGAARSPDAWAAAVDSVAELVRAKFPAVRQVVMQPVVGAPEGECRDVRAARNHPYMAEGIRQAAERGGVTAGPEPKVAGCDQFSDALGHLTTEGAKHVRRALRDHYRVSTSVGEGEIVLDRRETTSAPARYTSAHWTILRRFSGFHTARCLSTKGARCVP